MESNLMNCPTCGHSVSNAAGACAYCGAIVSEGEQNQQTDENIVAEESRATESAAPLPQEETPSAAEMSDEVSETSAAAKKQSDADRSKQLPEVQAPVDSSELETEAVLVTDNEPVPVVEEVEGKFPEYEQKVESEPEFSQQLPDAKDDSDIALTEAAMLESSPHAGLGDALELMQGANESETETLPLPENPLPANQEGVKTESVADEIQVSAELETLNMAADEPAESITPQEGIIEMVEFKPAQQEHASQTAVETSMPSEIIVDDVKADDKENLPSTDDSGMAVDAKLDLISEVSEDTILLDISDEVELPPAHLRVETAKIESPASAGEMEAKPVDLSAETQPISAEILKIEKAARDMAAAIEKQKASVLETKKAKKTAEAKDQALKQQKAALAKARSQKKQKMILAKAAALKRKKAAQAKAQALKRQKADQVAIEPAIMEKVAAANINREGSQPKVNQGLQTNNKMQGLLEKYKGQAIGINYDNSAEIRKAQLVEANGDFFSVFVEDQKLHYSYPLKTILTVIEGQDGVDTGYSEQPDKFNVVIKVYPLVHI
ncbi:MAG: hypothetical protein KJP23_13935 [Deltaproteobacteria bacterium]|nr:hypothetical protein [Deltaproteobacteria bacterium]